MSTIIAFALGMLTMYLFIRWAMERTLRNMGVLGGLKTLKAIDKALDARTRAHIRARFEQFIADLCDEVVNQRPEFSATIDRILQNRA
jgi:hypothetical protein